MNGPDPSPDPGVALARALAEHVIARLGPEAPPLRIRRVERTEPHLVLVELSARVPGASRIGAYLTTTADRADALAATASQLQVHVLELTRGDLLPPCPGHGHPLDTDVIRDEHADRRVACWVCPKDPAHHAEPILPVGWTSSARSAQFSASSSSGGQEQTRLRSP